MDTTRQSPPQNPPEVRAAQQPVATAGRRGWVRVFPPAPARSLHRRGALVLLAAVGVGTGMVLARQPGAGALDTVWAEDGRVFLGDALNRSPLAALSTSYAGYYHLVPRLLAQVAALAPAGAAAAVLAVEAAVCTASLAVLVYVASAGHLSSRMSRFAVAAIVVVLPLGQGDLPNSIANLHWSGLYALFWMLLWTPSGRAGRIIAPLVVVLVAASDILVAAYLPLAFLRLLARRDRYSALLAGLLAAGLAAQVAGLLTGSSSRTLAPSPVRWLTGYVVRAVPAALLGERWLGTSVDAHWLALAATAWLLVAAALALAALTSLTRPNVPLAVVALVHSVALYALPVTLSGIATPRYAAAPAMLLVTGLAALLQPGSPEVTAGTPSARAPIRSWLPRVAPLGGLTVLLSITCAANLRVDNPRAHGPSWSHQVHAARGACAAGRVSSVEIPIPPAGTPPWSIRLPCEYVA